MTSYHDLEEQTYRSVAAERVTRIHGEPKWRTKERLKSELTKVAIKHKVSYNWSAGKGLIPLIIGAARYAADYPNVPAFVDPVSPPNTPAGLGNNPTQAQVRVATDENNLLKRDWAVVCGFKRGASELIRGALDSEYYDDLEHVQYGYDDVTPREFIEHLEDEHCPLDEAATTEVREHYFRGWERNKTPRPEGLKKFAKRLDEEQESLGRDGVTISDADKKSHYLIEVFHSGCFPAATIREWKKKPTNDQTYANAKTFFQEEYKGYDEVHRLMGDSSKGNGYESAKAAIEDSLENLLDKFNETVEERIRHAVEEGIQRMAEQQPPPAQNTDSANAANEKTIVALQRQIETLTKALTSLQKEFTTLAATKNAATNSGTDKENRAPSNRTLTQWSDDLEYDPAWTPGKKKWYSRELKKNNPTKWKAVQKTILEKRLEKLSE